MKPLSGGKGYNILVAKGTITIMYLCIQSCSDGVYLFHENRITFHILVLWNLPDVVMCARAVAM